MRIQFKVVMLVYVFVTLISCKDSKPYDLSYLQVINDSIKQIYAPDKRVAIYNIDLSFEENQLVLKGETDQKQALETFIDHLKNKGKQYKNLVHVLPDSSVGDFSYALVNNSVANIRSRAKHSGELATQAILGTPLKVLKIAGDFYLIQSPDGYISWVDHGGVTLFSNEQIIDWEKSNKVIYTKTVGFVYRKPGNEIDKISDIVLGSQLLLLATTGDYYKVQYPDKRIGYLKKSECQPYDKWLKEVRASGSLIELYAKDLLGAPYLWGGTSSKGMDCSGFTKTVYLMNGYVIPRDASQQIMAGVNIDPELNLKDLQKGDLMFFGRKATDSTKQRVTHVGIWLGNEKGEFIHASGRVKIGSIDQNSERYDAFNKNRYLGSRRYLGHTDKLIRNLKEAQPEQRIKS